MKLKKMTLENFRSFKGKQEIAFAPITLLFGANSVGKSSIIKAIKKHASLSLSDAFHGEDTVSVGLYFDFDFEEHKEGTFGEAVKFGKIRRIFQWHENKEYAKNTLNVLKVAQSIGVVRSISKITLEHSEDEKKSSPDDKDKKITSTRDTLSIYLDNEVFLTINDLHNDGELIDYLDAWFSLSGISLNENHPLFDGSSIKSDICHLSKILENAQGQVRPHASNNFLSILSGESNGEFENTCIVLDYFSKEIEEQKIKILSVIMTSILLFLQSEVKGVDSFSKEFDHLGPLRSIPDMNFKETYSSQRKLEKADWGYPKKLSNQKINDRYLGRDAWDLLAGSHDFRPDFTKQEDTEKNLTLIDQVNDWLAHWFNTPYAIDFINVFSFLVNTPEKRQALAEGRISEGHLDSVESSVQIRNLLNGSVTSANEVGVGISQLTPVIVKAIKSSAFGVEQPELHIHPKMQTVVADLFVFEGFYETLGILNAEEKQALSEYYLQNNRQFISIKTKNLDGSEKERYFLKKEEQEKSFILAETHSEHLMLRLLKRVRQNILDPDDLAVYYFQSESGASKPVRIGINEEGDFTNQWPEGFFEERLEELF